MSQLQEALAFLRMRGTYYAKYGSYDFDQLYTSMMHLSSRPMPEVNPIRLGTDIPNLSSLAPTAFERDKRVVVMRPSVDRVAIHVLVQDDNGHWSFYLMSATVSYTGQVSYTQVFPKRLEEMRLENKLSTTKELTDRLRAGMEEDIAYGIAALIAQVGGTRSMESPAVTAAPPVVEETPVVEAATEQPPQVKEQPAPRESAKQRKRREREERLAAHKQRLHNQG